MRDISGTAFRESIMRRNYFPMADNTKNFCIRVNSGYSKNDENIGDYWAGIGRSKIDKEFAAKTNLFHLNGSHNTIGRHMHCQKN